MTSYVPKGKRKSYEKESLSFSTMLRKMADEWEAMVTTARMRRQVEERRGKEEMREIEKQEKLDWERWEEERGY